ncbi:MAG TPA: acetylornithine deacetylase, partial [Bacteroidia bacterium]
CEVAPRSTRLQSSGIDRNHPVIQAARKIGIETFGSATTSDMALWKLPAVKIGPGKSERSHTADEFIFLREIEASIVISVNLLMEILQ